MPRASSSLRAASPKPPVLSVPQQVVVVAGTALSVPCPPLTSTRIRCTTPKGSARRRDPDHAAAIRSGHAVVDPDSCRHRRTRHQSFRSPTAACRRRLALCGRPESVPGAELRRDKPSASSCVPPMPHRNCSACSSTATAVALDPATTTTQLAAKEGDAMTVQPRRFRRRPDWLNWTVAGLPSGMTVDAQRHERQYQHDPALDAGSSSPPKTPT